MHSVSQFIQQIGACFVPGWGCRDERRLGPSLKLQGILKQSGHGKGRQEKGNIVPQVALGAVEGKKWPRQGRK